MLANLGQAGTVRESVELLKDAMAGAMFSENSLDFTLGYSSMPTQIKTHLQSFSERLAATVSPEVLSSVALPVGLPELPDSGTSPSGPVGLPELPDSGTSASGSTKAPLGSEATATFLNQLSDKSKTRFMGLMLGVPSSRLLSSHSNEVVQQAVFNQVLANPSQHSHISGLISAVYDPQLIQTMLKPLMTY